MEGIEEADTVRLRQHFAGKLSDDETYASSLITSVLRAGDAVALHVALSLCYAITVALYGALGMAVDQQWNLGLRGRWQAWYARATAIRGWLHLTLFAILEYIAMHRLLLSAAGLGLLAAPCWACALVWVTFATSVSLCWRVFYQLVYDIISPTLLLVSRWLLDPPASVVGHVLYAGVCNGRSNIAVVLAVLLPSRTVGLIAAVLTTIAAVALAMARAGTIHPVDRLCTVAAKCVQAAREATNWVRQARQRTCCICYEEVPAGRGVACRGPDAHFTCDGCLERIVIDTATQVRETNELVAQAAAAEAGGDRRRAWFLAGCVCCPFRIPDCPSEPYADRDLAQHVSTATYEAHVHARTLLPIAREAQQVFERAQETMRTEVDRIRAQMRAGREVEHGRALLAAQLRQQMPNARQCRQCGFGPIDHMACADLQAHHGQQFGNARINNACPQCGWFSRNIRDWPAWDGRLPREANAHG